MFLKPVTNDEVFAAFVSLGNGKTEDAYGIQIAPLKYATDLIAPFLTHIFNACLSSAVFPRNMQPERVTVIYKKGSKDDLTNYHPISILPVFSKGFKKMILQRLLAFSDKHKLITPVQYSFQKN